MPSPLGGRRLHSGWYLRVGRLDARLLVELDSAQRVLALDDAQRAVDALRLDEVVERARLVDVLCDMRREGRRHLAALGETDREAGLLDRGDDPLRLRHELRL